MKEKLLKYLSYFIYCLIIIYSLYGCIGTTSPKLKEAIAFKANSKLLIFTPNGNLICTEIETQIAGKVAIFEYKKHYPIHYFGGFYNIDSNNLPFGIRYYPEANKIWLIELKALKTNVKGQDFFANNFSQFSNEVFQFDNGGNLIVQGTKFTKFELNEEVINSVNQFEKNLAK